MPLFKFDLWQRRILGVAWLSLSGLGCGLAQPQQPSTPADVVFLHGNILTGSHLRPNDPDLVPARVAALAVAGGRVVAAGRDAEIAALKGPQTVVVDLHGAFAMPGFNDAHTHMAMAGQQRLTVDLIGVPSLAAMQAKVRSYAATLKPGQWVLGGGWDHTLWATRTLPTRSDLDAVTGDHPALLLRVDGHIAVANSAALAAAHLHAATPDPEGGKLDRDAGGELTGIVREAPALLLVQSHIPKPDTETRKRALLLSINDALAHGVTSVQDFSDGKTGWCSKTWSAVGTCRCGLPSGSTLRCRCQTSKRGGRVTRPTIPCCT